jgi:hypothetical protein
MIRRFSIAVLIGFVVMLTGCATPGSAAWNSMSPPAPSGGYADG